MSRNRQILVFVFIFISCLSGYSQSQSQTKNQRQLNEITTQIDTLKKDLNAIRTESKALNETIAKKQDSLLEKQNKAAELLKALDRQSSDPAFNVSKDFIYPFILSMFSAFLFWWVFSFRPEQRRHSKLRPKLELDMYHIYTKLFTHFDLVLASNGHSPSHYQQKIRGGGLTKDDIKMALQNKCLNETYQFDKQISSVLMPIGLSMKANTDEIDKTIDKIFDFSNILTPAEILLLENIRKKMSVYSYTRNAESNLPTLGKMVPVNPSLSYMTENLFELYGLFQELEKRVENNKLRDRNISIQMIQYLYYSKQYRKCIQVSTKLIKKYPNDWSFLEHYRVLSHFKLNEKRVALNHLGELFKSKQSLISSRSFLSEIIEDADVSKLMQEHYSEESIRELYAALDLEKNSKTQFENNSATLAKYYAAKAEESKKKAEARRNQNKNL